MLPVLAISALGAFMIQKSSEIDAYKLGRMKEPAYNDNPYSPKNTAGVCAPPITEMDQAYEDFTTGDLRTNVNLSGVTNVLDDPMTRIVRPKNPMDSYDVIGNAMSWLSEVRQRNNSLASLTYFSQPQASRKTVVIPRYENKPVTVLLKSDAMFPGLNENWGVFCKMDNPNPTTAIPCTINPANYRDIMGDYKPFNMPKDTITNIQAIGNPWGPGGFISRNMIDGGNRIAADHDYIDYSIPPQRRVRFTPDTKQTV